MMIFEPRPHQTKAIDRLIVTPQCALFAKPGSGKTAIMLTTLKVLMSLGEVRRTLIVAPLQVCATSWPDEIDKWAQFRFFDYRFAHGKNKGDFDHQIVAVNPEQIAKLNPKQLTGFDTLIVDEPTKFKNWSRKRTKAIRKIVPLFVRRHIMTGTPTPRSSLDWFAQQFIVDGGASFGKHITRFRHEYFVPHGYKQYQWRPKEDTAERLAAISAPHVCVAVPTDGDIPDTAIVDRFVELPAAAKSIYKSMERRLFATLTGVTVIAISSGVAYGKCRQIASGALYDAEKNVNRIHREKTTACARLIDELQGRPVVVLYHRSFEADMLYEEIGKKNVAELSGRVTTKQRASAIKKWNAGDLRVLMMHPAAAAHGLNLQDGGSDMIWLTLPDDGELYTQANCRLPRLGSLREVTIYRIIVRGTVERVVVRRLEQRASLQNALLEYCQETTDANNCTSA